MIIYLSVLLPSAAKRKLVNIPKNEGGTELLYRYETVRSI